MSIKLQIYSEPFQRSEAWFALRKTKITATDARVLLGTDPWKTRKQLFEEKTMDVPRGETNQYMQRGIDLEDTARAHFEYAIGIKVEPKTVVAEWQMASLDGMSENGEIIVEIKCPGAKDHAVAVSGKVPEKYMPQLQHIMCVCGVPDMFYFSFDGLVGVTLKVYRDDEYIEKMIEKEREFYECMKKNVAPEILENEFVERDDEMWKEYASQYLLKQQQIKELTDEKEMIKNHLIYLSQARNTKGAGISLKKIERVGSVDYSKIPELDNIDIDQYRGPSTFSWRIS